MRRVASRVLVAAAVPMLAGCAWVGLTWGALTYPTTGPGEAANVAALGEWAYVTRGAAGIETLDVAAARSRLLALPAELDSADDVAIADGLLFVLDARPPGHLAVFSLADPARPRLVARPVAVDVGPFSGVSASGGRVVVSGGTGRLSLRTYGRDGTLGAAVATADFGRGQPDVLVAPPGDRAFVSTHEWGPYFSLAVARLGDSAITPAGSLALPTYGFTPGGARPANFPLESAAAGPTLFVASAGGLAVIDAADAAAPTLLALLPLDVEPVNVDVRDEIAALVGSSPRPALVLVDVRDRARPQILQSFPLPEGSLATGVALTASHAVVAAHGRGVLLFDRAQGAWEHVLRSSEPTYPKEFPS